MLVNSFVYIHSDRWRYIHQHTRDFSASDTANSAYVSRNGPGRRYTSPARPRSAHAPPSPRSSKRQFEAGRPEMGRGASLISAPDVTLARYCRAQMLASQTVAQWLTKSMGNSRLRRSALRRRRRRHLPVESGTGRTARRRRPPAYAEFIQKNQNRTVLLDLGVAPMHQCDLRAGGAAAVAGDLVLRNLRRARA